MMSPRTIFSFLLAGSCLGVGLIYADDTAIPQQEPFARYEPMLKRSPFAVATAGAPVGATPDFAKELYVANAGHSNDGDFVTIASTTNRDLKLYLTTKAAVDGYSIPNIQWSDRVGETKVTLAKDGQVATLSFNEAVLSQAIQNAAPPMLRAPNGVPGTPNSFNPTLPMPIPRPMTVPTIPTPPPYSRPIIRRGAEEANRFRHQHNPTRPANDEPHP